MRSRSVLIGIRWQTCAGSFASGLGNAVVFRRRQSRWQAFEPTPHPHADGWVSTESGPEAARHLQPFPAPHGSTLGYLHTGDLRALQDFLGHADPRMTAKYAHVVDMAKKNPALFIPVKVG